MKKVLPLLIVVVLLAGCGATNQVSKTVTATVPNTVPVSVPVSEGVMVHARFVDVGQGDCEILKISQGGSDFFVLIDTGDSEAYNDVCAEIREMGISRINVLVLTHPDADHIANASDILNLFPVDEIWVSGFQKDTSGWHHTSETITAKQIPTKTVQRGQETDWNGSRVKVLNPSPQTMTSSNNSSVVLLVSVGENDILLTGDAENEAQSNFANDVPKTEVFKVPHHGSDGSYCPTLISKANPQYSVIEVGAGNRYGHPSQTTLQGLLGSKIYRTDVNGDISADVTSESVVVTAER